MKRLVNEMDTQDLKPWEDWETCVICNNEGVCIDPLDEGYWTHKMCLFLYIIKDCPVWHIPFWNEILKRMEHRYG